MLRTALVGCLLGMLAAAPAPAAAHAATFPWPFWLRKPEAHGSRKMPGDYKPVYATYRYHSREKQGPLSFLRSHRPGEATARHHRAAGRAPQQPAPRHSRMTL